MKIWERIPFAGDRGVKARTVTHGSPVGDLYVVDELSLQKLSAIHRFRIEL